VKSPFPQCEIPHGTADGTADGAGRFQEEAAQETTGGSTLELQVAFSDLTSPRSSGDLVNI